MAKVSVIVPVYNVEKYLDVCLDSLINQTFDDFEIICINDGSTDSCLNILRQYAKLDRRIKIFSQKNLGLSAARNAGMRHANGEYIVFVDSDDFLSPAALEKMHTNMSENDSDFMFSYAYQILPQGISLWELPNKKEFTAHIKTPVFCEKDLGAEFYLKMLFSAWAKMYKKSFIKDFSFPEGLIFEDLPFFAQCWLNAEKISYDLEPLYFYRKSSSSIMSDAGKNFIDIFEINKIISKIFEASGKFEKYRTILLVSQMESSLVRTLETSGSTKREMFNLLQKTYGNIDFYQYDMNILKRKNIYYAYQTILNKSYRDFRHFETHLKGRA